MEIYFFDIPVFRCSREKWNKETIEQELRLARIVAGTREVTEEDLKKAREWLVPDFTSYQYSELIGMIRLYAMPGQIRAETFFVKNRRLVRNQKNKKWTNMGKLFEFMVFPDMSNEEIHEWLITKLKRSCSESYLKRRNVELACFEVSGPYINYRELTNLE